MELLLGLLVIAVVGLIVERFAPAGTVRRVVLWVLVGIAVLYALYGLGIVNWMHPRAVRLR